MNRPQLPRPALSLLLVWCACGGGEPVDPGRVTVHRLNNAEYNNTVRDLFGTSLRPADDFPADDRGYGFDNVADALSLSPLQLELYERAAETLVDDALRQTQPSERHRSELEIIGASVGGVSGDGWLIWSNGEAMTSFDAPVAGRYRISARAFGQQAGPEVVKMSLGASGAAAQIVDVPATRDAPAVYSIEVVLAAGNHAASVGFVNDFYDEPNMLDRNLWVDYLEVEGPIDAPAVDPSLRQRILVCDLATGPACVTQVLTTFTRRAWRRPPAPAELDELQGLVALAVSEGDDVETGVKLALRAALVSPSFVYRIELDPDPASKSPHRLTDWELASRLSYFLWSSMPDDELLAAAERGDLADEDELRAQATRMLADPKAAALVDNFAGQWLFTRALGDHVPDYVVFPDYDAALEAAMGEETRRFFADFLANDLPMDRFLDADWTFVNDRLARHYDLPAPGSGDAFVKVSLAGSPRRGLLGQASVLTVTSYPRRTSPVKRGKWVLDQLLCEPPKPPPPGVEALPDGPTATGTVRDRLEAHRDNPFCASCHQDLDPLGFGLDDFDGIGKHRTEDGGLPIDASGVLPDGRTFVGAVELAGILAKDPRVYRCMVEKLYTYSAGRPPKGDEALAHIDELTAAFVDAGYKPRELILALVTHDSFRSRRGEP
jgi:hypothetical protein